MPMLVLQRQFASYVNCTSDQNFYQFDLRDALRRALGGGLSGAAAMFLQVLLLMVLPHHLIHFLCHIQCLAAAKHLGSFVASSNDYELSVPLRNLLL